MTEGEHFYVVSYDIHDNRRRLRVMKILEDFGDRVQLSVFELRLDSAARLARLQKRLLKAIDSERDSVRIYRLCGRCVDRIEILGQGSVIDDKDFYVV